MNPEATSSAVDRLGMPRTGFYEHDDDRRCEARTHCAPRFRSMGMLGMGGRLAVRVVVYDERVKTHDALMHLRAALSRLADHLRQGRREAA